MILPHATLQLNVAPTVDFLEIRAESNKRHNATTVNAIQVFELSAQPRQIQPTEE